MISPNSVTRILCIKYWKFGTSGEEALNIDISLDRWAIRRLLQNMELLSTIIGVIVDHAWDPIRRRSGYLICYKRHIEKLESKFKELDDLRKDVQGELDAARRERVEEVKCVVQTWLTDVNTMKGEVNRIKEEASVISTNCFLRINLHYKLGREAVDHIKTTYDLIRKGNFSSVTQERQPPSATDSLLFNEDYMIFYSRQSRVEKIVQALKNEVVNRIGLWGMGGGGKTTLVKEIAKQAKEHGLFDEVVMVTISQNIDIKRTQKDIADCLHLELTEDNVEVRADKLAKRLTQNNVLVILDDLWEPLQLSKVGIRLPQMAATCKAVITTRNRDVCERMRCGEIVELEMLSNEESWSLFRSRVGDAVESPTLRELARKVARECAGLPLALVVLGTALKCKGIEIWEAVLMRLKSSKDVYLPGVSKQLFESIQLSFDFLESEVAKSCFLHCCLYPEDWNIHKLDLMHIMAGGDLLADVETLYEAQKSVDVLLDQLIACGLLLQGQTKHHVKMHDVVRDVAIRISAKDHAFYVRAGQGLAEWPRSTESEMRNCQRLSLTRNDIRELPPDPMEYPKLETLILCDNKGLSSIPKMFFQHMGSLMVLDLSYTRIESLPKSLSCVTNLRVLNLTKCRSLKDISHINGLKMLETLILQGAPVSITPEVAAWSQNLRFVDLTDGSSSFLDDYFSKELPRFSRLERLFMNKFSGSFPELISLRHLTHLFILEPVDLDDSLSHELVSPGSWPDGLLKFALSFLPGNPLYYDFPRDRNRLKLMGTKKPLAVWIKKLLEKTLMHLVLAEFQETELVSINSNIPWLTMSSLEYLVAVNWPNLTKLLGDELLLQEQNPLSQLKRMSINNCPKLTSLIPSSLWRSTQKIEELRVKNCPMMLELFPCDHKAHEKTELDGLLQCLPNLKRLYIDNCGVRYVLSFEMETVAMADPFPTLTEIDIRNCQEMNEMISPRASLQAPCLFQELRRLDIRSCGRLTHLFSYEQAIGMHHLGSLVIKSCAALKAVVISTENGEGASASTSTHVVDQESNSLFPNLRYLELYDLPQLTAFHHPAALPIDSLYLLYKIEKCPHLQHCLFGPRTRAHELLSF